MIEFSDLPGMALWALVLWGAFTVGGWVIDQTFGRVIEWWRLRKSQPLEDESTWQ